MLSAHLRPIPVAVAITALHALLTWWRLSRSWFWQDDFNLLASAADRPLTELMFSEYNEHLVPGSWVVAWLSNTVAPLSWTPVGLLLLVLVVATDVAFLAALVRLFGPRPAILAPYALFCASTLTLTATLWAAAALQWMPATLALALGVYFLAGYVRRPNARDLWGGVAALVFGLAFFEKAVLIPAFLGALAVAYFVPGPLWRRPWRALRRYLLFWVAQGTVAGLYLWLYLSRADVGADEARPFGDYLDLVDTMVFRTFLPGMVGGPLDWFATPEASLVSWSGPPGWLAVTSWVLAGVVIGGSTLLIRGAWRAWVLLLLFLGVSVTLVARARLGLVGPFIGRDHRYLTDAALFGPLCLALALVPLRDGLDRALHGDPRRSRAGAGGSDDLDDLGDGDPEDDGFEAWPAAAPDPEVDGVVPGDAGAADADDGLDRTPVRRRLLRTRGVLRERAARWHERRRAEVILYGALVLAVVAVGGVVSSEQYMKTWERNPAPEYFRNLETGLNDPAFPKPVFMFDAAFPPVIMTPTFEENRMFSHVLKIFGDDAPVFGWWSSTFLVVDASGKLYPGQVAGPTATPPTGLACSQEAVPQAGVSVTLPQALPTWDWKIELTYSADQDTAARVRYGDGPAVPLRLRRGLNKVVVAATGAGPQVHVTDLTPGAVVCIGKVVVGNPVPDPNAVQGATGS